MGMRVHINSSLNVTHVVVMDINGWYFFDDHVSLASASNKLRMFYVIAKYKEILVTWERRCITT